MALAVALAAGVAACGDGGGSATPLHLSPAGKRGQELAQGSCSGCHTSDGRRSVGPTWKGLAGSKVDLEGGETVTATDAYLTRSITDPHAQVVKGFGVPMPTFSRLTKAQVADLVAYIKDLADPPKQATGTTAKTG
jgi:cytochrome c oxidase subunit 2